MHFGRLPVGWIALGWLSAMPALAGPPSVTALTPERSVVALGESAGIRLEARSGADAKSAWPPDGVEWLFVRAAGIQENLHDARPAEGTETLTIPITQPGVTMIGVDRRAVLLDMTAAELLAFAELAGASSAVERLRSLAPEAPLRVRHVASAKALVRAATGAPRPSMIATSKAGQAVEIRLHVDPTLTRIGSDVPLVVYVEGDKRPGLQVRATIVSTGESSSLVTDAGGAGHVRITAAGPWRLEFHEIVPVPGDPSADWLVSTATLAFDVAAQGIVP